MTTRLTGWALWRRWTLVVTGGEAAGFLAPAVVGVLVGGRDSLGGWLLLAGAVEGAVLGLAQASVLRRVLPALDVARWVVLTGAAAVLAYALGDTVGWLAEGGVEGPELVLAGCAALLLLSSLGGMQWAELHRHVDHAWTWVGWTAAAWLLALSAFLAVATPLWHDGQATGTAIVVGVGAGILMAAVQAAVTGWAAVRLTGSGWSGGSVAPIEDPAPRRVPVADVSGGR